VEGRGEARGMEGRGKGKGGEGRGKRSLAPALPPPKIFYSRTATAASPFESNVQHILSPDPAGCRLSHFTLFTVHTVPTATCFPLALKVHRRVPVLHIVLRGWVG